MARPEKLNAEVQETIVRLIRGGNTVELAAEAAGVTPRTYYKWMERGKNGGRGSAPYVAFRAAVEQARAEGEAILVTRISQAAAKGSWQAAAWLLERRFGQRWGKNLERKPSGDEDEGEAEKEKHPDPLEDTDELAARRARAAS